MYEFVENITDMPSQLDISLVFLQEISKDLKSIKKYLIQITDDVRILKGKKFDELLQIRKIKGIQLAEQDQVNSIYVPLKTIEYNPITGENFDQDQQEISILLVEKYESNQSTESLIGEVNEFLWDDTQTSKEKEVLLIRGLAGSGKSRSAQKIKHFLWAIQGSFFQQQDWIPIYISLPSIQSPKYSLLDQAMKSEYYNFDSTQTRKFKEAIQMKKIKAIFILDSYDEMKLDCVGSNLIITNKLIQEFNIQKSGQRSWFYGSKLENLKDVEQNFDHKQVDDYQKCMSSFIGAATLYSQFLIDQQPLEGLKILMHKILIRRILKVIINVLKCISSTTQKITYDFFCYRKSKQ